MLKFIDLFGTSFQFTIFKQFKFKTILGAILTILSIIMIIIFIYLFGKDFFLKLNPKINQEDIIKTTYDDPVNITNNNLILAFRIEDEQQSYTPFENYLFPYFEYRGLRKNNISTQELKVSSEINYERCDNLNLTDIHFKQNYNLNQWFCIDFTNSKVKMGGDWDTHFVDYFRMTLNFIEPNGKYDIKKLKEFLNKGRYISFLLPIHYFDFSDQIKPLKQIYKHYFYKLNYGIGKYDRIYLKNISSNDDRGWLLEETYHDELFSTSNVRSDFYIVDDKDIQFNYLYKVVFYYEKDIVKISRNYMKIQDLSARMGGFISFVLLFCQIITYPYNVYKREKALYNLLFEYKEFENKKIDLELKTSIRGFKNHYDHTTTIMSNRLLSNIKIDISKNNKNNRIHFSFFQYIKFNFFPKCISKNQVENMNLYKFLSNYIKERLDISYYKKFIENVKHFRMLLLDNKEQNLSFNYIKNPNINDKNDLKYFDIELQKNPEKEIIQLINYYRNIKERKIIKNKDRVLFSLLDPIITKYVGSLD